MKHITPTLQNLLIFIVLAALSGCGSNSDVDKILHSKSYEQVLSFLHSKDTEVVSFALWQLQVLDRKKGNEIIESIWNRDGKHRDFYNPAIEENIQVRLMLAQILITKTKHRNEAEHYLLQMSKNNSERIRGRSAEFMQSAATTPIVITLRQLLRNDTEAVAARAYHSLLTISNGDAYLYDSTAVTQAQDVIIETLRNIDSLPHGLRTYIERIDESSYKFSPVTMLPAT